MTEMVLPQFGMGMADGTIIAWYKNVGDLIVEGEPICEVEAAKTNVEVVAPRDGILQQILVPAGGNVPVNSVIAIIGDAGAELVLTQSTSNAEALGSAEPLASLPSPTLPSIKPTQVSHRPDKGQQIEPRARRAARNLKLDLGTIVGTGPRGRIIEEDVLRAGALGPSTAEKPQELTTSLSRSSAALCLVRMNCANTPLSDLMSGMADAYGGPVSVQAILIRAAALALDSVGQKVETIGLRSESGSVNIISNPKACSARGIDVMLGNPSDGSPPSLILEAAWEDGIEEALRLDPFGPMCLSVSAPHQSWSQVSAQWCFTLVFSEEVLSMGSAKKFMAFLRELIEKPLAIVA